jgi:ABC-2 type transport system ATP-binding protein
MPVAVLQTEHLTKRFGALTAVKDLCLVVEEGEILGFLGPNGAGKTTSILMMCGLLEPDGGRVLIHGTPVRNGNADMRARVGICPQETVVWARLTCLEQLEFTGEMYGLARREARRRGAELLGFLQLDEKGNKLASTLSGGMKRRLNIALALVHDPDLVVLDEPEAGLDPQSRVLVREFVQSLARKKTVIVTTHNMDEADRVSDRVAIIDRGELLVCDTPDRLKKRLGGGDVLEISVPAETFAGDGGRRLVGSLAGVGGETTLDAEASLVQVRIGQAVERLPSVLKTLDGLGVRAEHLRVRGGTLEDVFLQLTGRRLRE